MRLRGCVGSPARNSLRFEFPVYQGRYREFRIVMRDWKYEEQGRAALREYAVGSSRQQSVSIALDMPGKILSRLRVKPPRQIDQRAALYHHRKDDHAIGHGEQDFGIGVMRQG